MHVWMTARFQPRVSYLQYRSLLRLSPVVGSVTCALRWVGQADKTALMDVPEGAWAEAFAGELKTNLKGRPLDYLMLGHFNPRVAKTLAAVHPRSRATVVSAY